MQFLNWGKQSSIFGLPICLALIFAAFFNIYGINELLNLVRVDRPYLVFHNLGTLVSQRFDFPRVYLLIKMVTGVLWGCVILINVAIFRRAAWLAYVILGFAALYYAELTVGLCYGIYAFAIDDYLESKYSLRRVHIHSPFPWPTHFWVLLMVNLVVDFLFATVVLDMHWSYIKILQHNGSGWESKAYFEIHQSEGETVATLQEQWDARMGLESKQQPELDRAIKREELQRRLRDNEETPLITEV